MEKIACELTDYICELKVKNKIIKCFQIETFLCMGKTKFLRYSSAYLNFDFEIGALRSRSCHYQTWPELYVMIPISIALVKNYAILLKLYKLSKYLIRVTYIVRDKLISKYNIQNITELSKSAVMLGVKKNGLVPVTQLYLAKQGRPYKFFHLLF